MENTLLNGRPYIKYDHSTDIGGDGQIVLPKFTTDEQVGLTTITGSVLFNTDTNTIQYFNGSSWKEIS